MIIQIRGTSGSGKTTVMRKVMEGREWQPHFIDGRKKPLYYTSDNLVVLGHYETACGGCDTIGSARQVYETIQKVSSGKKNLLIVCEGLLLSEDVKWAIQMEDLKVFFLVTTLDTCLERVKKRRVTAGNLKPLNEKNTTNRVAVIERARKRLVTAGVSCKRVSCGQAVRQIKKLLGDN